MSTKAIRNAGNMLYMNIIVIIKISNEIKNNRFKMRHAPYSNR